MRKFTEEGKKALSFNRIMKRLDAEKTKQKIECNQNKNKKKENKK